jgi:hypothetical protein
MLFALVAVFPFVLADAVAHQSHAAEPADEGIRIDLPLSGQLRIENRFGDVRVDVKKQKDVLVAVAIAGAHNSINHRSSLKKGMTCFDHGRAGGNG